MNSKNIFFHFLPEMEFEKLVVKNATKLFNSAYCLSLGYFQWSDLTLVSLPKSFKHFALDPGKLRVLFDCYKTLYPREEI